MFVLRKPRSGRMRRPGSPRTSMLSSASPSMCSSRTTEKSRVTREGLFGKQAESSFSTSCRERRGVGSADRRTV